MNFPLCILATGGTIDKIHDPVTERLVFSGQSNIPQILHECRITGLEHHVLMLKDSLDLTDHDRQSILEAVLARCEERIVITHGTSTMPLTAEFLDKKVGNKTVILTGAMRPFSLFQSDAAFNLGGAILAARMCEPGVYIVMNGQCFVAGEVQKDIERAMFVPK